MSRVEIEVDDELLAQVAGYLGTRTPDETVDDALRTVLRIQQRIESLDEPRASRSPYEELLGM